MGRGKLFAAMAVGLVSVSCGGGDDAPREYPGMGAAPAIAAQLPISLMKEVDSRGVTIRQMEFAADGASPAGQDGVFFTGDDHIQGYQERRAVADSATTRWVTVVGPGPDALWYTEDDDVHGYSETSSLDTPPRTRSLFATHAGSDGVWFTQDDSPENTYREETFDIEGKLIQSAQLRSGVDELRFTADDVVASMDRYEDTPVGRAWVSRWDIPQNSDISAPTNVSSYTVFSIDAYGRELEIDYDAGADRVAFNEDDLAQSFTVVVLDSSGRPLRKEFGFAGLDGAYSTSDDLVRGIQTWEYREDGSQVIDTWGYFGGFVSETIDVRDQVVIDPQGRDSSRTRYANPGPDQVWLTVDDVVEEETVISYGTAGRVVRTAYYEGADADGVWLTSDDRVAGYRIWQYDATGAVVDETYFFSPGADQRWFSEDDAVGSQTIARVGFFGGTERSEITYVFERNDDQEPLLSKEVRYYRVTSEIREKDVTISRQTAVADAGSDGAWFTADDKIDLESVSVVRTVDN